MVYFLPVSLFVAAADKLLFLFTHLPYYRSVRICVKRKGSPNASNFTFSCYRQTSPTTSYVKALDVWMLMCILFTTLPLLQYALILS